MKNQILWHFQLQPVHLGTGVWRGWCLSLCGPREDSVVSHHLLSHLYWHSHQHRTSKNQVRPHTAVLHTWKDVGSLSQINCLSCIFKQECNVFVQPDFRSTSQSMTVTGMMSVGLSLPSLSLSIIQVGLYLILENLILDHWYIWQNVPLIATVCAFTDWLKRRPVNNKNNTN